MIRSMRTKKAKTRGFRPGLEAFEARLVLSTILASPIPLDGAAGSLRAAITTANSRNSHDVTILAAPGTYRLSQGELPIEGGNITIKSTGPAPVKIVASGGDRIFEVESGFLWLNNVSMTGGHLDGGQNNGPTPPLPPVAGGGPVSPPTPMNAHPDKPDLNDGGAILVDSGAFLAVNNCSFLNNYAGEYGGAIEDDGGMVVNDSTFANNNAVTSIPMGDSGGGAIEITGYAVITNSTFSGNISNGPGGAIKNDGAGSSVVVAPPGSVTPANVTLPVTLANCTFSGNTAIFGGAIASAESIAIAGSTFSKNSALETGGALDNNDASMILTGSTFTGNFAGEGGGIYNGGGLSVVADTFTSNNSAGGGGGAIFNDGSLEVRGSSFNANSANSSVGGAIDNFETLSVTGSSFTGNYATYTGSAVYDAPASTAILSASTFVLNYSAQYLGYAIENDSDMGTGSTLTMTTCYVTLNDGGVANEVDSVLNLNGCVMVNDANDDCLNNGTANVSLTFTYFNGTGTVNHNP